MFEIEKQVPVPPYGTARTGLAATLKNMDVGDSVHLCGGLTDKNRLSSAFSGFTKTKAGAGKRFTQRKTSDGFRIWRIA
ncbi:hypothetical protein [Croceicoccus mobilis]|uniref:hypothetical protein n=1 Tax=Croceicoccus mobilis TaxID=1703339 RepID=UPI0012E91B66|nr:hypothetical protein [Croceicoccus mobilis]